MLPWTFLIIHCMCHLVYEDSNICPKHDCMNCLLWTSQTLALLQLWHNEHVGFSCSKKCFNTSKYHKIGSAMWSTTILPFLCWWFSCFFLVHVHTIFWMKFFSCIRKSCFVLTQELRIVVANKICGFCKHTFSELWALKLENPEQFLPFKYVWIKTKNWWNLIDFSRHNSVNLIWETIMYTRPKILNINDSHYADLFLHVKFISWQHLFVIWPNLMEKHAGEHSVFLDLRKKSILVHKTLILM